MVSHISSREGWNREVTTRENKWLSETEKQGELILKQKEKGDCDWSKRPTEQDILIRKETRRPTNKIKDKGGNEY